MVYLDNNATTPVDKRVIAAMLPYFSDEYANPASDHAKGISAKIGVNQARSEVAKFIGSKDDEIIFTSGATEANNIAILGLAKRQDSRKNHLITSRIEHPAVLKPAEYLESQGYMVTYISVNNRGEVDIEEIRRSITPKTLLISIMAANNEIGTLEPIKEIGSIAREKGVLFHTDAAQAVGHIPINVDEMNIDLLSVSAHKFYGPKGVGCIFMRNRNPRVRVSPIMMGGGQEKGVRSGTLNTPGIVGLAEACKIAKKEMRTDNERYRLLTTKIYQELKSKKIDVRINGDLNNRLLHTINIEIPGVDNKWLSLKLKDFCISTGSACSQMRDEPSHVLLSIGLSPERAANSIRIGVGKNTTDKELEIFINKLTDLIGQATRNERLRS